MDKPKHPTILKIVSLLQKAQHAVVLTGAGISTPSGIPDFRSPDSGIWKRYDPAEVATLSAFRHNPTTFYHWLHLLAEKIIQAEPNPAHLALAQLEQAGKIKALITQNIDGLHQKAGAKLVIEVHGTFQTLVCIRCYRKYRSNDHDNPNIYASIIDAYLHDDLIPHCPGCGSILKPDIILFEEQLPALSWIEAQQACRKCDLLIIAGSSLEVMPVAGLPMRALENGARLVSINKTATYIDVRADAILQEDVAEVLPQIAEAVLNG